jgi:hypothetical protein
VTLTNVDCSNVVTTNAIAWPPPNSNPCDVLPFTANGNTVYSGTMYVSVTDSFTTGRGTQTRTWQSPLPFQVITPTTITLTTSSFRVVSAVVVTGGVVQNSPADPATHVSTITILTEVQYPYKLATGPTLSITSGFPGTPYTAGSVAANSGSSNCTGISGSICVQAWDVAVTPQSGVCSLLASFAYTFTITCSDPLSTDCPLGTSGAPTTASITVQISGSNWCTSVSGQGTLTGTLVTYRDDVHTIPQTSFTSGTNNLCYFYASFTSQTAVTAIAINYVDLLSSTGTVVTPRIDSNSLTQFGVDSVAGTIAFDATKAKMFHLALDPSVFTVTADSASTYRIGASFTVTYGAKRQSRAASVLFTTIRVTAPAAGNSTLTASPSTPAASSSLPVSTLPRASSAVQHTFVFALLIISMIVILL